MTSAATPISVLPVPEKIGRYRILCELGHGAMAVIYLGRAIGPRNFERLFAIKTIHQHLCRESSFVEMFLDEARLAARIHHPNVIPVYEADSDSGRYYIAMEYVSGESLATTLKHTWTKGRPFPIDIATHLIAEACEGLHAAHELKDSEGRPMLVVHRDVAPQNVMLGYDGTIRVMDFGIAKAIDRVSGTRPGTLKGTVAYMSPEQIRTERLDRRSDVFGLGVVLWETTVGKRLFKSENDINTAARVMRMNIPHPSTLRKNYPVKLDEIIMRALSRDPAKRQASARALGEELRDVLAGEKMRVAAPDVERFMKDVYGAMYDERAEMERKATSEDVVSAITPPIRESSTSSLSEIESSVVELLPDDSAEPTYESILLYDSMTASVIPEAATERSISTSVIRERNTQPPLIAVEASEAPTAASLGSVIPEPDPLDTGLSDKTPPPHNLTVRVDIREEFPDLVIPAHDTTLDPDMGNDRSIVRTPSRVWMMALGGLVMIIVLAVAIGRSMQREAPAEAVKQEIVKQEIVKQEIVEQKAPPPPPEEKIIQQEVREVVEEPPPPPPMNRPQPEPVRKEIKEAPKKEKRVHVKPKIVKRERVQAVKEPPPPPVVEKKKPTLIGGDDL